MSDVLLVRRDLDFLLHDWLRLDELLAQPRFADHSRETVDAVLDLSEKLAADVFLPTYKASDHEEPRLEADGVHVLPGIRDAVRQYAELGLFGAGFEEALGGMGLPYLICMASFGQFTAASIGAAGYIMLAVANARLIATFGTPAQIERFARPQIEGRWLGTMCLSEPQAGSSLADIRTRAEPDGEDAAGRRYRLTGNKMWISGADQDISENIVHLVLAKVPGPDGRLIEGTKGISLFIVPKWIEPGVRNDAVVVGLNHKMGYRGTVNTLLNFGEGTFTPGGRAGAIGWLVGEVGQGLPQMFQMMNEARITVGLGGAVLAYRGYRHALAYARDRIQGRPLAAGKGAGGQPVALIEHADVKRMLLAQKAYAEGALALILYSARLVDQHGDAEAAELLGLLTPVAKTWPSEWGLAANDLAIQVHGGYGYTRDFDVEQLYRDNRLNPIHEGTTGIQALDLLGRKILRNRVDALGLLGARIADTCRRAAAVGQLAGHATALGEAWQQILDSVGAARARGDEAAALQNATWFLQAFGHVVVAWLWLDIAILSAGAAEEDGFHAGKLWACRFYFETELPKIAAWLAPVTAGSDVAAAAPAGVF